MSCVNEQTQNTSKMSELAPKLFIKNTFIVFSNNLCFCGK
jgi:hypothetical protein